MLQPSSPPWFPLRAHYRYPPSDTVDVCRRANSTKTFFKKKLLLLLGGDQEEEEKNLRRFLSADVIRFTRVASAEGFEKQLPETSFLFKIYIRFFG